MTQEIASAILEKRPEGLRRYSPYELIGKDELTFGQADKLQQSPYGRSFRPFDPGGLPRAAAAAECLIMERAKLRGDTGAPVARVHHALALQYATPVQTLEKAAAHLAGQRGFILKPEDPEHIWIGSYYRAENVIADIATKLSSRDIAAPKRRPSRKATLFPGTKVERVETLSNGQYQGARTIAENRFSILCGPGGSGKTTTIAAAAKACAGRVLICSVAACAGQYASEVTGCEAATIASLTTARGNLEHIVPRPDLLAGISLLVVEEASMAGARQMAALLTGAFKAGVPRILLCGDHRQLPPIGAGAPFHDLIASGVVPMAELEHVFRSAEGSGIQALAASLRDGSFEDALANGSSFGPPGTIPDFGNDVEFVDCWEKRDDKWCQDGARIVEKFAAFAEEFGLQNTIAISPFKGDEHGTNALNRNLRAKFGHGELPEPGEILMCVRNMRGVGLLNGMRAIVEDRSHGHMAVRQLRSKHEPVVLPLAAHARGPARDIVWGYAATTHKFQGSEADAVLVALPPNAMKLIENEPLIFDAANLYVACTRPRKRLAVMGDLTQLADLLHHGTRTRITALQSLLKAK